MCILNSYKKVKRGSSGSTSDIVYATRSDDDLEQLYRRNSMRELLAKKIEGACVSEG